MTSSAESLTLILSEHLDKFRKISSRHKQWLSIKLRIKFELIRSLKKLRADRKMLLDELKLQKSKPGTTDPHKLSKLQDKISEISEEITQKQKIVDQYGIDAHSRTSSLFKERIQLLDTYKQYSSRADEVHDVMCQVRMIERSIEEEEYELYKKRLAERKAEHQKLFSLYKKIRSSYDQIEKLIKEICPHEKDVREYGKEYGWTCIHCERRCALLSS